MSLYLIYDENKELMRTVSRQEEARAVVNGRAGWTFKLLRSKKKSVDLTKFEEALF